MILDMIHVLVYPIRNIELLNENILRKSNPVLIGDQILISRKIIY
jgi:hypothetical protein